MNTFNKPRKYIFRLRGHMFKLGGKSKQQDQQLRVFNSIEESSGHRKTVSPYSTSKDMQSII